MNEAREKKKSNGDCVYAADSSQLWIPGFVNGFYHQAMIAAAHNTDTRRSTKSAE